MMNGCGRCETGFVYADAYGEMVCLNCGDRPPVQLRRRAIRVVSQAPMPAPVDRSTPGRLCLTCTNSIAHRSPKTVYCLECSTGRKREQMRRLRQRLRVALKEA